MPAQLHPDWYRKVAKKLLVSMRTTSPQATLSQAQFQVARAHGYSSWRALIAAIKDVHQPPEGSDAKPPLHEAAQANDVRAIERLIDAGADLEARFGQAAHTALSWAVVFEAFQAAAALIAGGAKTDLFCAAALGDLPGVRSFFSADDTLRNDASHTSHQRFLSLTARTAPPQDNQAIVSAALYAATRYGHAPIARFLMARGARITSQRYFGASLLHWAHYGGSQELVGLLIDAGADEGERDDTFESTPRAFAICAPVRLGLTAVVAERLRVDPSLATINEARGTPLHEAVRQGDEAIVRILLAHGADPAARDSEGRVPRDLATGTATGWAEVLL